MNQEIISLKQKINRGDICVGAGTAVQVGFEELKRILETGDYDYLSYVTSLVGDEPALRVKLADMLQLREVGFRFW